MNFKGILQCFLLHCRQRVLEECSRQAPSLRPLLKGPQPAPIVSAVLAHTKLGERLCGESVSQQLSPKYLMQTQTIAMVFS